MKHQKDKVQKSGFTKGFDHIIVFDMNKKDASKKAIKEISKSVEKSYQPNSNTSNIYKTNKDAKMTYDEYLSPTAKNNVYYNRSYHNEAVGSSQMDFYLKNTKSNFRLSSDTNMFNKDQPRLPANDINAM